MGIKEWIKNNTTRLDGQTIAITGTTGGLGKAFCFHVASLGANMIFLNRNKEKSEQLISQIQEKYPDCRIDLIRVDMQDLSSVKKAVNELKKFDFNILVLNAGAYKIDRCITKEGYDNIYQINFISPYYMVKNLLEYLREKQNSRVVVVGSIAHNFSKIDEKDIDFSTRKKCGKVYGNSKRQLMFALYELFKYENKVKLAVCHPGITYTNITSHYPKVINAIIKYPMKLIFSSAKKASLTTVLSLFESTPYHMWIGPRVFNIWGYPKKMNLWTTTAVESHKIEEIANTVYNKVK